MFKTIQYITYNTVQGTKAYTAHCIKQYINCDIKIVEEVTEGKE